MSCLVGVEVMVIKKVTREKLWIIIGSKIGVTGESLVGYFDTSINEMKRRFGKPDATVSLDGKATTVWVFVNTRTGEYIDFYDYKETSAYDYTLPSPEAFRKKYADIKFTWHVGSNSKAFARSFANRRKLEIVFGD